MKRPSEQIAQDAGGYDWNNGEMNESDVPAKFVNGILRYLDLFEERINSIEQRLTALENKPE